MRECRRYIKYIWLTVFLAMAVSGVCPLSVRAADRIRVGCVDIGNFIQIGPDGRAYGYGAEYLDKIAGYAGWEYEYVQASWEECLKMLKTGEIELLLPAEYSEERAEDYLFSSYECCFDFVALIGRRTDNRLYYDDYAGFDGLRVGMIKGNYLNGLFEDYAKTHGFTYESVLYDTGTGLLDALDRQEVDAIVNGNMEFNVNQKLLAKIDYMPAYLITSVNRPDLMERLNRALKQVFIENPYFSATLYDKYYGDMEARFAEYTREEIQFIKGSGPVTVLITPDDYPFEWYDRQAKACRGAFVDYMKYLGKISGLQFVFVPSDSGSSLEDGMVKEDAQIIMNIFRNRLKNDGEGLSYTSPYYSCSFSLVGKRDEALNLSSHQRIAVVEQAEGLLELLQKKYPLWEVLTFESPKECLKAVEDGAADCAMISSIKLSADRDMLGTRLLVVDGNTASVPMYMAVTEQADPLLVQVLSKTIAKAGSSPIDEAVYRTVLSAREPKGFSYFVRTYPVQFAVTVVAISLMAMGIIFISYDSRHQKLQNLILQKKNEELKAAIAMQKQLRRKAQTDLLTGLKNKTTTEELCRACIEDDDGKNLALFIIDLDDFKQINDEQGHQAGDTVLKAFGAPLQGCIRQDDIAGRIGGDEFMMLLSGVKDRAQAAGSAERIYTALKGNPDFNATCSMGIVLAKSGQVSYEELFRKADAALYTAKDRGKDLYHITETASEGVS